MITEMSRQTQIKQLVKKLLTNISRLFTECHMNTKEIIMHCNATIHAEYKHVYGWIDILTILFELIIYTISEAYSKRHQNTKEVSRNESVT